MWADAGQCTPAQLRAATSTPIALGQSNHHLKILNTPNSSISNSCLYHAVSQPMKDNEQNSSSNPTLTPPVLSSLRIVSKGTKHGNFACSKSSAGNPGNQARLLLLLTTYVMMIWWFCNPGPGDHLTKRDHWNWLKGRWGGWWLYSSCRVLLEFW